MPIYEFKCEDCGREFELLVCSTDTEKPACKYCKSISVSRLLSRFSARGVGKGPAASSAHSCASCHTGKSCSSCS